APRRPARRRRDTSASTTRLSHPATAHPTAVAARRTWGIVAEGRPPFKRPWPYKRANRPKDLLLAARAIEGGARALHQAADLAAAARAREALAAVDGQSVLVLAGGAVGVDVVGEAGAAVGDAALEHGDDRRVQPRGALGREGVGAAARGDRGVVQRLARVDVADAGEARLVEQERLDVAARGAELRAQVAGGERGIERVEAENLQLRRRRQIRSVITAQNAESARVDVAQLGGAFERKHRVRVRAARLGARLDQQVAAHAEVDEQHVLRREIDQQVLADAADGVDARVLARGAQAGAIDRAAQRKARGLDAEHAAADEVRLQAARHRLDLGQLRHAAWLRRWRRSRA